MKFTVLNYISAQKFQPQEPTLAIRIFDPGCDKKDGNNPSQKLQDSSFWVAQLTYTFDDVNLTVYEDQPDKFQKTQKEFKCFDSLLAKRLVQDFEKHLNQVSAVMIHCNAGVSRSVAVAAALVKKFNLPVEWQGKRTQGLMKPDYLGNEWVYYAILEA